MPPPRNIILTGFMGSGKTTVGRRLARKLRWRFVDLDRRIERSARMTIAGIFARRGEPAFRRLEAAAIRSLAGLRRRVIATGGGAPLASGNRRALRSAGLVVWLRVPSGELARRLRGGVGRPLLAPAGGRPAGVRRLIGRLLRARLRAYRTADLVVPVGRRGPAGAADRVARAVAAAAGRRG